MNRLCGSRNTDAPLEGASGDFLLLKDLRAEIARQPLGAKSIHSIIGASVNLVIVEFFRVCFACLLCLISRAGDAHLPYPYHASVFVEKTHYFTSNENIERSLRGINSIRFL